MHTFCVTVTFSSFSSIDDELPPLFVALAERWRRWCSARANRDRLRVGAGDLIIDKSMRFILRLRAGNGIETMRLGVMEFYWMTIGTDGVSVCLNKQ